MMTRAARIVLLPAVLLQACSPARRGDRPAIGQWVWSSADAELLREGQRARPGLRSAVWIGSLRRQGDTVVAQLGLSPARVADASSIWVVRLDDSLHPLVDSLDTRELAVRIAPRLTALIEAAERGGTRHALQLDYDAPVSHLPKWAALVRELRRSAIAGRSVWVTSLLVHVEQARYGAWMRGVADGHVLQLFDTQMSYTAFMRARVERALERAGVPVAIGLGAFERVRSAGRETEHRAWFEWTGAAVRRGLVREVWIFPAGRSYLPLLSSASL